MDFNTLEVFMFAGQEAKKRKESISKIDFPSIFPFFLSFVIRNFDSLSNTKNPQNDLDHERL